MTAIAPLVTEIQIVCKDGHVQDLTVGELFNVYLAEGLIACIGACNRCGARADWRRTRGPIDVLRPKTNNV